MPKTSERDRVKRWLNRIESANKVQKEWETKYHPEKLYRYYLGHQWEDQSSENYVMNEIFATIETQLPQQLFYHPKFIVKARPAQADDAGSSSEDRAKLQEDTLNTKVSEWGLHFKSTVHEALLESYFRYGVIEVGYSADFVDNPNAGKPMLNEKDEPMMDGDKPVLQGKVTLRAGSERLYLKRIPAANFRASVRSENRLEQCDWYGYFEWHYPEDLKKVRRYKNTENVNVTGKSTELADDDSERDANKEAHKDMVKVWKIWDIRGKQRLDFSEGGEKFFLEEKLDVQFDGSPLLPHAVLKKHPRLNEWLPLPAVYNWISPQNEENESRNMQKIYRRKLVPKFGMKGVDDEEVKKFLEPIIQVLNLPQGPDSLWAIGMPPADAALLRSLPQTRDDLQRITGTSSEQKGLPDAETATQANIIQSNAQIRESKARVQVADWLARIGYLMLYFLRHRMQEKFWIQENVDMYGPNAMQEILEVKTKWREIKGEDLGDLNSEVSVDVDSISPATIAGERTDWIACLTVLAQQPMILMDETLLRKTLGYFGVRDTKVLMALKRLGMMMMAQQAAMQQAEQAKKMGAQGPAPGPTPDNAQITQQLAAQIG